MSKKLLGSDRTKRLRKKRAKHCVKLLSAMGVSANRMVEAFHRITEMAKQTAMELAC